MRQIPPSEQDMKRLVSKKKKIVPCFGSQEDFFKSQVKNEEMTGEHVWQITQNVRKVAQATIIRAFSINAVHLHARSLGSYKLYKGIS